MQTHKDHILLLKWPRQFSGSVSVGLSGGPTLRCTRQSFAATGGQGTAHMGPDVPLHMELVSCAR